MSSLLVTNLISLFLFIPFSHAEIIRVAMIQGGIVESIAVWDKSKSWAPGSEYKIVEIPKGTRVDIGCAYDEAKKQFNCENGEE